MKKILIFAVGICAMAQTFAQTSVGVSIGIQQPGVYGRIDIGNYPPPRILYPQPVIIVETPMAIQRSPIYLYVPPGHQQNWGRYCGRYNACDQPVYFVQEEWVRERYDERRSFGRDRDHDRGDDDGPGNSRGHSNKHKNKNKDR